MRPANRRPCSERTTVSPVPPPRPGARPGGAERPCRRIAPAPEGEPGCRLPTRPGGRERRRSTGVTARRRVRACRSTTPTSSSKRPTGCSSSTSTRCTSASCSSSSAAASATASSKCSGCSSPSRSTCPPSRPRCARSGRRAARNSAWTSSDFGGNTVLLSSYPTLLGRKPPHEILRGVVDHLLTKDRPPTREAMLHHLHGDDGVQGGGEGRRPAHARGDRAPARTCGNWPRTRTTARTAGRPRCCSAGSELDKQFRRRVTQPLGWASAVSSPLRLDSDRCRASGLIPPCASPFRASVLAPLVRDPAAARGHHEAHAARRKCSRASTHLRRGGGRRSTPSKTVRRVQGREEAEGRTAVRAHPGEHDRRRRGEEGERHEDHPRPARPRRGRSCSSSASAARTTTRWRSSRDRGSRSTAPRTPADKIGAVGVPARRAVPAPHVQGHDGRAGEGDRGRAREEGQAARAGREGEAQGYGPPVVEKKAEQETRTTGRQETRESDESSPTVASRHPRSAPVSLVVFAVIPSFVAGRAAGDRSRPCSPACSRGWPSA